MRHAHMLRENKGSRLPVLVIAFDTETDSVETGKDEVTAKLRFGWLAQTRRYMGLRWTKPDWHRYETPTEMWDIVESYMRDEWRVYLFAHNVGFDFRVLDGFRQLEDRGYTLKGAVTDDPPTILRYHKPRRGLILLDTLNYYRTSLREIGKTFGLEKLDHDYQWGDRERDDEYCRRDVDIVLRAVQGIIRRTEQLDLGNFAVTFPALAFGAFRHRHMRTPILIDDNPKALALARSGYYGGRCEAFRLGEIPGTVDTFDVNSMYPAVMLDTPMPTVLRGFYRSMTVADLAISTADATAVADVTIDTQEADYPVVNGGRLIFPVGTFRTVLPGPELTHALNCGRVVECHSVALYDHDVIFRSFIEEWYARRLEAKAAGDTAEDDFCKRMMNSLYGKFGQSGKVWEDIGPAKNGEPTTWEEIDLETGEHWRMRSLAGTVQKLAREQEARESHPAIAAVVTSEARLRLLRMMNLSTRSSVVYVDTDSIFRMTSPLPLAMTSVIGNSLGMLKQEHTASSLTIHGLKDYTLDGVRKTKGIRKDAEMTEDGGWRQDQFEGLKGAIATNNLHRQRITKVTKHLTGAYLKGVVLPDGRIEPYRFGG